MEKIYIYYRITAKDHYINGPERLWCEPLLTLFINGKKNKAEVRTQTVALHLNTTALNGLMLTIAKPSLYSLVCTQFIMSFISISF